MDFIKVFNETWELIKDKPLLFSSEMSSSCSDSPQRVWYKGGNLDTAEDCIAFLLILPTLPTKYCGQYFDIVDVREHIGKMAHNFKYEGKWEIVGEILANSTCLSIRECWTIALKYYSTSDWFGNMIHKLRKAYRIVRKQKLYSSVVTDDRPVTRPKRKRGYDDKGHLREKHKWLPNVGYQESEKPEKRPTKEPNSYYWFKNIRSNRRVGRSGLIIKKEEL